MSRLSHESSAANTPSNGSVSTVMVYLCECGTKWTHSPTTAWTCRCGKQLEKRNGIIHAAIDPAAGNSPSLRLVAGSGE